MLEKEIQEQLKAAMRSKNQPALRALRALKSALLLAKTESGATESLSDDDILKHITKLVKQRKDSIAIYQEQNRQDLAADEIEELDVLQGFLPEQLSIDEVEEKLKVIIAKIGASTKADMGKVMGAAMKELGSATDGKTISAIAGKLLS